MPGQLLIRGSNVAAGDVVSVSPGAIPGWNYIDFRVVRLPAGASFSGDSSDHEIALVFISGSANVRAGDDSWERVGTRSSPFSGPPDAIYFGPRLQYVIRAQSNCEIAICEAAARGARLPSRRVTMPAGSQTVRGTGHAQRSVHNILMDTEEAAALFITEVLTPPGNWSSYPPHKHDEDNPPIESALEEIYYYRAFPETGFAFQRVYTADGTLDETMTVHDTDCVLVPRGYHVSAAAAGYSIYYLNVLAGPKHVYHMTFDPEHAWIKEGWTW